MEKERIISNLVNKEGRSFSVYSNKINSYSELNLFKNEIELAENGPLQKPYTVHKSSVLLYRTIFLCIGVLYSILGLILFIKPLTWTCTILFGSYFQVKTVLCSLCSASSIYCLALGFLLKSEKEAVKKVFSQAKSRLRRAYETKAANYRSNTFFALGEEYRKSVALKQIYLDAREKMQEYMDETLNLLSRITTSYSLDVAQKEELYNQAILEFRDKTEVVINRFKSSNLRLSHTA